MLHNHLDTDILITATMLRLQLKPLPRYLCWPMTLTFGEQSTQEITVQGRSSASRMLKRPISDALGYFSALAYLRVTQLATAENPDLRRLAQSIFVQPNKLAAAPGGLMVLYIAPSFHP